MVLYTNCIEDFSGLVYESPTLGKINVSLVTHLYILLLHTLPPSFRLSSTLDKSAGENMAPINSVLGTTGLKDLRTIVMSLPPCPPGH